MTIGKTLLTQMPQDNETVSQKTPRIRWSFRKHLVTHLADHKGRTIQDIADEIGVHRNTIGRWKSTDYLPQIEDTLLAQICFLFDIEIQELLEIVIEIEPQK